MAALANWRERLPMAALLAGILSLCVGGGMYLVYGQLGRPLLVLFALGIGLLAFCLAEDYEGAKRLLSGRTTRYGGNTAAMILIFLAIVGVVNFFSERHSYRLDLTAAREFSLSPQTLKIVASLQAPVKVTAFFRQGDFGRSEAEDLLKEYRRRNDKIQFEIIDWEARPGDALRYKLQSFPVIVMESGNRRQDITGFTEQDLTSGLFKVAQGEAKKVYFTSGHGEPDLKGANEAGISDARTALENSNYQVQTINLATTAVISDDVAALVIYAPKTALLDTEKKAVKNYLDRGGKAMLLVAAQGTADLSDLLQPYGLKVGEGVAIDAAQSLVNQPFVPVVTSYPDFSPVTRDLAGSRQAVLLPLATQITVTQQITGVTAAKLLQTTDRSWLTTDEKDISYKNGDVRGPLSLAIAATADAKTAESQQGQGQPAATPGNDAAGKAKTRLVVFGSADFATNLAIDAMANRQLFVNAVNWLTEEEALIGIRPQAPVDRSLMLTGVQANLLLYSSALFLPLVVAAAGGYVWWRRR